jgi:hypothetical protein
MGGVERFALVKMYLIVLLGYLKVMYQSKLVPSTFNFTSYRYSYGAKICPGTNPTGQGWWKRELETGISFLQKTLLRVWRRWISEHIPGGKRGRYTVKRVDEVVRHPHLVTQDQFSLVSEKVFGIPEEIFTINIELFLTDVYKCQTSSTEQESFK